MMELEKLQEPSKNRKQYQNRLPELGITTTPCRATGPDAGPAVWIAQVQQGAQAQPRLEKAAVKWTLKQAFFPPSFWLLS